MDYSNLFVCLMGLCTVFVGLICIIVLVSVMSNVVRRTARYCEENRKHDLSGENPLQHHQQGNYER